jgi:HlyD family secretion protein
MRKPVAAMLLSVVMLAGFCGCSSGGTDSTEAVSVQSVGLITGTGSAGTVNRYPGKIISGDTVNVKKDADKIVKDVLVKQGDNVHEGDVLFTYDTEEMKLELEKLKLDLEGYENTISTDKSDIVDLKNQMSSASSSDKLSYTLQIEGKEADIQEAEYNKTLKQRDIDKMQASMADTDIKAPISGRIMSVSDSDTGDGSQAQTGTTEGSGTTDSFITIMDMDTYRVEGTINELNKGDLTAGMKVIIRSRLDETKTWTGTIDTIDWENPVNSSNQSGNGVSYSSSSSDDMTTSSKYPFYVKLDSEDGLIFGQHVYIEPDYGQNGSQTTLMLPASYICDADSSPYVWAASDKQKLEKRSVTLGAYDEALDEYEVLSGLSTEDYIATPTDTLKEGMAVTYYDASSFSSGETETGSGSNETNSQNNTQVSQPFGGGSTTEGSSPETAQSSTQPSGSGQTAEGAGSTEADNAP